MIYSRVSLDKNEISDQPATTSERSTFAYRMEHTRDWAHRKTGRINGRKNCTHYLNYPNCLNKFLQFANVKYFIILPRGYPLVACLKSDLET